MKFTGILIVLITFTFGSPANANIDTKTSKKEIREVVETFRLSIINKDKDTFKTLFYSDNIPWIAVFSDEMVKANRKDNPDFPRTINFGKYGPPVKMISDEGQQEEKMWNIRINTDGYLASVHFNYSDNMNGIKKAFGTESWDLVKVGANWKIVSVTYTVTEAP